VVVSFVAELLEQAATVDRAVATIETTTSLNGTRVKPGLMLLRWADKFMLAYPFPEGRFTPNQCRGR
jgi:hypothetical protein